MGNTPTTSRKVFEQLDKEKCGRVNLQEILLSDTHTSDVPMLCSLATLYHVRVVFCQHHFFLI